jgi:hypothetical protein
MVGCKSFYNARRVLIGIELVKEILKGKYRVSRSFGSDFHAIWKNALTS